MADSVRRTSLHLPWSTLLKILAALALVWLWTQLVWMVLLVVIAIIIAVALAPVVTRLERHGWPRWLAAGTAVLVVVGLLIGFFVLTGSQLGSQARDLGQRLGAIEQIVTRHLPQAVVDVVRRGASDSGTSLLAPYLSSVLASTLRAVAAFVFAWILVAYLLIEGESTYRWIRGFVPARHRPRFDRTVADARKVAFGFAVGNFVTSACAAIYFFIWLQILGVPAALLLALLAFIFDFIPVLGFYLSCLPAMAMAATKSPGLALAMIPIYLSYDFIENYLLGPYVYGERLRLSRVAVLLAFAVGAQLGGVVGAVLALPLAAIYPTVEKRWLRRTFGEEVVREHEKIGA